MLKKLNNKKGFTLMEMLIVVAIIAVLVAIAIPVFNGALTKSKEAADVANIRALYAEWQVAILTDNEKIPGDSDTFLKGPQKATTAMDLNYKTADHGYTFTAATSGVNATPATITYKATKLTDNATGDKTFTWTLTQAEIN